MGKKKEEKKAKKLGVPIEVLVDEETGEIVLPESLDTKGKKDKKKDKKAAKAAVPTPTLHARKFKADPEKDDSSESEGDAADDPETIYQAMEDTRKVTAVFERDSKNAYEMSLLRACLSSRMAAQKVRIQISNRIMATIYTKLGYRSSGGQKIEDAMEKEAQLIRAQMFAEFGRVSEGMTNPTRRALIKALVKDDGIFTNEFEVALLITFNDMLVAEREHEEMTKRAVRNLPLWNSFFKDIPGAGEMIAAYIMCMMDPYNAPRISSFWKYAGLDVVINPETREGVARKKCKEHMVKREYVDKAGNVDIKDSLTFKPILKSKLIKVLGDSLMRKNSPRYRQIYDYYKHRKNQMLPADMPNRTARLHAMSIRYMIKQFVADLWVAWRKQEGLPITAPYAEAKLGLVHGGFPVPPKETPVVQSAPEPVVPVVPEYLEKNA